MSPSLPAPRLAEAYELLEVVRRGGLSTTFRAVHRGNGETRFIDVLRSAPGDPQELERRLDAEARPLLELRHPHVAEIVDFAVGSEGQACIVRAAEPGEDDERISLRRLTRERRPSLPLATELLHQAAAALAFLHEHGRHIGELAPVSYFLGRRADGHPHLRLVDLGLAKSWQEEAALTAAGLFIGRLRYASPEQFDDRGSRGPAADVYDWGLIAYELLTGTFPVSGESPSSLIAGHLFRPPIPFSESDPGGAVPEGLRALVLDALEKDPGERPYSAEVRSRLETLRRDLPPLDPAELDHWLGERRASPSAQETEESPPALGDAPTVTLPPTQLAQAAARARGEDLAAEAGPDLEELLAEARNQARSEDFVEARKTVRRILEHDPEHEAARRLLASVEACLKIQLEESHALETVRLPPKPSPPEPSPPEPSPPEERQIPPATDDTGHETVRLHAGSETETVRLDAVHAETSAVDAPDPAPAIDDGRTRDLSPDLSPDLDEGGHGPQPPGTITVPMKTVQAAKERQEEHERPPEAALRDETPGPPPIPSFDDEGVGHPTSFGKTPSPRAPRETAPEDIPPEDTPPKDPARERVDSQPAAPSPTQSAAAPNGLSDLHFGDREAGYQGTRPRERRRPRSPSPLDAPARKKSRSGWWIVGSVVAALLVFAVGYVISSGVDPMALVGGSEEPLPVAPAEPPAEPAVAENPGFLLLDAEPWAEIVEVRDAAGERQTLRVEHTPARIPLAPGAYTVILADPVRGERQTLEVEIVSGETLSRRASLRSLTVDEYFREVGWNE